MNDNTILRIKVPAHLYESVKAQLTLNEAKKGGHNYGAGMEVVKEKKMKTPGMHKVEEMKPASSNPSDMGIDIVDAPGGIVNKEAKKGHKKTYSLEELVKAKKHLEKKIEEMENTSINEYDDDPRLAYFTPDEETAYELINLLPDSDEIDIDVEQNGNAIDLLGIKTGQMPK
jgi:hypothetical protein